MKRPALQLGQVTVDKIHFKDFMVSCFLTTCHNGMESLINNIKGKIILQIIMDKWGLVFKQDINDKVHFYLLITKSYFTFYDIMSSVLKTT